MLHCHMLSEVYQVVHAPVNQQVILPLVVLDVHNVGVVSAAAGCNASAQLQGNVGLGFHGVQPGGKVRQIGFLVEYIVLKVAGRKPGPVFQLPGGIAVFLLQLQQQPVQLPDLPAQLLG